MGSVSENLAGDGVQALLPENAASEGPQPLPRQARRKCKGQSAPRQRKETLLPQIAELAMEGYSSRAIGAKLGVPRRTVDHWLQEQRREWTAKASESTAEVFAVTLARLESAYRQAMEAWRRSQTDKQIRITAAAETDGDDGDSKPAASIRSETQSGQAALLGKAIAAALAIGKLKGLDVLGRREASVSTGLPIDISDITVEGFERLSRDQLDALEAKLLAKFEAESSSGS